MERLTWPVKFGSHLPVLAKALSVTSGDVLELGTGLMSTPFLHFMCGSQGRYLASYENDPAFYAWALQCQAAWHDILYVESWDQAPIERVWSVALIDHGPSERRTADIRRLAGLVSCIVIHDTYWKENKHYHYEDIWPLFRWRYDYTLFKPYTTLVSNFMDLSEFRV